MASDASFMDKLVALCKRRGFIFQSSEIYGGIGGFWDYGPLGVELKRNIKNAWWQDFVTNPPLGPDGREVQMVGLDCSIIMNPKVWEASGHATGFADPMVACKTEGCNALLRADQVTIVEIEFAAGNERGSIFKTFVGLDNTQIRAALDQTVSKLRRNLHAKHAGAIAETYDKLRPTASIQDWAKVPCPSCGNPTLTEPRQFNLMFESYAGALKSESNKVYLRPETAQGIFANYKNVVDTSRVKTPFGIAQVGKAFRNEINPRNFTFRSREFEQMEIEFFCKADEDCAPGELTAMDWFTFWRRQRIDWYQKLGLASEKLRPRDQGKEELAHYSKACTDIEYMFPFSDEPQELEGVAHRGCFDLTQHEKHSGVDLHYFDETAWSRYLAERKAAGQPDLSKEQKQEIAGKPPYRYLPTVIEPSAGADRATLAFLCEAYTEDQKPDAKGVMQTRIYMRFHPRLAPIKAAFFPLVNKEGMPDVAENLYRDAKKHMNVFFDDGGSIGKRYARMDEAGTPFCITIDGDTIKSEGENAGMVTIRDRDTLEQIRVHRDQVTTWLKDRLGAV